MFLRAGWSSGQQMVLQRALACCTGNEGRGRISSNYLMPLWVFMSAASNVSFWLLGHLECETLLVCGDLCMWRGKGIVWWGSSLWSIWVMRGKRSQYSAAWVCRKQERDGCVGHGAGRNLQFNGGCMWFWEKTGKAAVFSGRIELSESNSAVLRSIQSSHKNEILLIIDPACLHNMSLFFLSTLMSNETS